MFLIIPLILVALAAPFVAIRDAFCRDWQKGHHLTNTPEGWAALLLFVPGVLAIYPLLARRAPRRSA